MLKNEGIFQYPGAGWRSISHNMSCSMKNLKWHDLIKKASITSKSILHQLTLRIGPWSVLKKVYKSGTDLKESIKSGVAVVPSRSFTFAKQPIQFGRDPVKIHQVIKHQSFGFGGTSPKNWKIFPSSSVAFSPLPQMGTCGTSSSSSVGNDRKEGIWNLMANLKAHQGVWLQPQVLKPAFDWLIDWLPSWLVQNWLGTGQPIYTYM